MSPQTLGDVRWLETQVIDVTAVAETTASAEVSAQAVLNAAKLWGWFVVLFFSWMPPFWTGLKGMQKGNPVSHFGGSPMQAKGTLRVPCL